MHSPGTHTTSRLIVLVLAALGSLLLLGATATAQGNLVLDADIGGVEDSTATFFGFNAPGQTTGAYEDDRDGIDFDDWTWEKDGNDIKVYNDGGDHVCTYIGAANTENPVGAINDKPGNGSHGGNWERP